MALAVVMVIAPLWWVVVVLLLISAALVPALLLRQWRALAYRIVIVVAAAVAFGIQVLISSTVPNSSDVLQPQSVGFECVRWPSGRLCTFLAVG